MQQLGQGGGEGLWDITSFSLCCPREAVSISRLLQAWGRWGQGEEPALWEGSECPRSWPPIAVQQAQWQNSRGTKFPSHRNPGGVAGV